MLNKIVKHIYDILEGLVAIGDAIGDRAIGLGLLILSEDISHSIGVGRDAITPNLDKYTPIVSKKELTTLNNHLWVREAMGGNT